MKLPAIVISGDYLSDLFFNSELPTWKAHDHSNGSFTAEARAALLCDADTFINLYGIEGQVTSAQLADNFFARL